VPNLAPVYTASTALPKRVAGARETRHLVPALRAVRHSTFSSRAAQVDRVICCGTSLYRRLIEQRQHFTLAATIDGCARFGRYLSIGEGLSLHHTRSACRADIVYGRRLLHSFYTNDAQDDSEE